MSSLCEEFTDGDWIESEDQSDSGVRLIQTGNVGVTEYLDKPNNKKWISDKTFDRLHCEEVLPGDILISRLPEPAGRACIMPFLGTKMITAVDCTIVRTSPDVSNKFLVQYLSSQPYFNEVNTCLAGGTRQRISRSNLSNFMVPIPSEKDEQDAIGSVFASIDHLITLHQRKYEKLLKVKKSMLGKMFPRDGADVPEIRFDGFTDAWEQRKVSELAVEKLSNGIMNNQTNDETGVRHINVINMYDSDKIHPERLTFSGCDQEAVKKCNVAWGDIFLTRSSLKPEGIAEANVLLDFGCFVYDDHLIRLKVDKEKYDPFFVKLSLSGSAFKRQFIVRAKTTAFTTIGQEDIAECFGLFPEKEEQEKIGTYFVTFDHLITLHQRKYFLCNLTEWSGRDIFSDGGRI